MVTENNINLNNSECIVKTNNFTETIVTNICSGGSVAIPAGTMDILCNVLAIALMVGMVSLVGGLLILFVWERLS